MTVELAPTPRSRLASCLALGLTLVACDGSGAMAPPADASAGRDSAVTDAGSPLDAALDQHRADLGVDHGAEDASLRDVGTSDAGAADDAGPLDVGVDSGSVADGGAVADEGVADQGCGDDDGDSVCDALDRCMGHDDRLDADSDGVPDGCDRCSSGDDEIDPDGDGVPQACDICAGHDDAVDGDLDSVPDGCDACPGEDDTKDRDGDGLPNACDPCPQDALNDADRDGVCAGVDLCEGLDDALDVDGNSTPDCTENLLEGGQFRTSQDGFSTSSPGLAELYASDHLSDPNSSSLRIESTFGITLTSSPCVVVSPGAELGLHYAYDLLDANFVVHQWVEYPTADCSGMATLAMGVGQNDPSGWTLFAAPTHTLMASTNSVRLELIRFGDPGSASAFDNVLVVSR